MTCYIIFVCAPIIVVAGGSIAVAGGIDTTVAIFCCDRSNYFYCWLCRIVLMLLLFLLRLRSCYCFFLLLINCTFCCCGGVAVIATSVFKSIANADVFVTVSTDMSLFFSWFLAMKPVVSSLVKSYDISIPLL